MHGYNIKKQKYVNFHLVSLEPFIIGKQEKDGAGLISDPDSLSELYFFNSSLSNLQKVAGYYQYVKSTKELDDSLEIYNNVVGKNKYYVYSIDYLNKDFTIYFKFLHIKHFLLFYRHYFSKFGGDLSSMLDNFKEYFILNHYLYFKVKYTKDNKYKYSIVIGFSTNDTRGILERVLSTLGSNIHLVEQENLYNIQSQYPARIEFSYNIESGDIENIYFSDIQDDA